MPAPIRGRSRPHATPPYRSSTTLILALAALAVATLAIAGCDDGQMLAAPKPPDVRSARVALSSSRAGEVIPDQYIVVFRDSVRDVPGLAKRLVAEHGGALGFTYEHALKGFSAKLPAQAVDALARNPMIERVEPDMIGQSDGSEPNAPWGLDRIDQSALPLNGTYDYDATGAGVSVYIIDGGIRTTHVDFGGRAFEGFTTINDGLGAQDCKGHGTHVAGIVGGARSGVAKGVKLYAVRVLDCTGSGPYSDIIAGIDWVTAHAVRPAVANMSLGGPSDASMDQAVQNAVSAGIVFAVSAGNSSTDACSQSPASAKAALTVAASTKADSQAVWSNYGSCVDLYAPGGSIRSAYNTSDTSFVTMSGTSMAAPHVAGAVALYLETHPAATPAQVAQALTGSATSGVLRGAGSGSPNLLLNTRPTGATTAPTPIDSTPSTPLPFPPPVTSPVDQPPTASFTPNCPRGRCTFDASASTDDKGITQYSWNFGDGSAPLTSQVPTVTYNYSAPGSFTVTLTVIDAAAHSAQAQRVVSFRKVATQR